MKFIINEAIVYNELEGTLELLGADDSKTLLKNQNRRMLSIFVRNNGVVINREKLLNDVWEVYGLKASNNNLNTYASSLRRSFADLGEDEIFITYPKQGFKFAANSIVEESIAGGDAVDSDSVSFIPEPTRSEIETPPGHSSKWKGKRFILYALMAFILCAILFVEVIHLLERTDKKPLTTVNIARKGEYKNCDIYIIKNESADLGEIKNAISSAGFDCSVNANIYYYGRIEEQRMMLAYCPLDVLSPCRHTGPEQRTLMQAGIK
ncbi:winged helix-turn-helix domain-containing protein [Serratia nevei]|uniref:winged helix-turn-helix domain-containing protein n=1 Tax=Serratia TaxID=613 RepID=UPI0018D967AD|nr:winged helix-turn-helix domain-containing protein [Serratia marcescens]MBH2871197.1 winged helix-turn-helix domain-containing protein [Serratia marcescens]MBI6126344.1 winged helix-turn-helix domain-containing protein [Serratia marcescens]MBN5185122.1 winged helix-turn-helix domain-containing protein [Serratia marcescens]MBN5194898.1 winged helix-turn-helix domain-containing protein [Serratia marcescens]MBN5301081.1 winged helix-turn-helix domain-containing protein [Serratia marcescens]